MKTGKLFYENIFAFFIFKQLASLFLWSFRGIVSHVVFVSEDLKFEEKNFA